MKFAWSEVRAGSLWREGLVLARLGQCRPSLPVPTPVVLHPQPVLLATRLVHGVPLTRDWATVGIANALARFLGQLHAVDHHQVLSGLAVVEPTPQADNETLRRRFSRLVDDGRAASVIRWCDWVDGVLAEQSPLADVLLHGDLHGHNQLWNRTSSTLRAVLDFEACSLGDPHYDLRYLPGYASDLGLTRAVIDAYERCSGRPLLIERVMAWHVLTTLGDALWRTEAGISLPGGGTAVTYVDELAARFASLGLD